MDNGDMPAFASVGYGEDGNGYCQTGLTKREYFAARAMQGLLACPGGEYNSMLVAAAATQYADALLTALSLGDEKK